MKPTGDHLEQTIAATCRLVGGRSELRQVIVLSNRRLTADEYQRLHRRAAESRVDLWTTASGVTRLRPRAAVEPRGGADDPSWSPVDWLRRLLASRSVGDTPGGLQ
jgi:hypothetical protein